MILLTSEYPYANGESFIESEINSLEEKFQKIIILAIDLEPGAVLTREVPENVDCFNVTKKSKKLGRAGDVFCGAFKALTGSENSKRESEKIKGSFPKKAFLEYFCARSKRELSLCMNCLEKYDFSEYDNITIYSYWFFVTAMIGTMLKDELSGACDDIKLISRAHGYDLYENKNRNKLGYLPMRKFLLEKVDEVYPCSINGEKYLRNGNEEYAQKINYSYLGTVDKGITQCSKECLHIVSCSKIIPLKRVEKIAQALKLCSDLGPIKWTHIGSGVMTSILKTAVDNMPENISVNLLGKLNNSQVYEFYQNNPIDIFANVSTSEGLPVSIMEAMSFGIPVIATNVGGTSEIVKDRYNGWLLDSDFTDKELADLIKEIVATDRVSLDSMRKNARSFWNKNFNAEKNYAEFSDELVDKQKTVV